MDHRGQPGAEGVSASSGGPEGRPAPLSLSPTSCLGLPFSLSFLSSLPYSFTPHSFSPLVSSALLSPLAFILALFLLEATAKSQSFYLLAFRIKEIAVEVWCSKSNQSFNSCQNLAVWGKSLGRAVRSQSGIHNLRKTVMQVIFVHVLRDIFLGEDPTAFVDSQRERGS